MLDGPVAVDCGVAFTLTGAEFACLWRMLLYAAAGQFKIGRDEHDSFPVGRQARHP